MELDLQCVFFAWKNSGQAKVAMYEEQLDSAEPWAWEQMDPADDHLDPAELLSQGQMDLVEDHLGPAEPLI